MTLHCVWNEASAYFIPKYLFLTLGKEHALGFFVTAVADGSPAQSAGLKVFVVFIYIYIFLWIRSFMVSLDQRNNTDCTYLKSPF